MKRLVGLGVFFVLLVPGGAGQAQGMRWAMDPTGDVETWHGIVLPGGPQWEPASEQAMPADLEFFSAAFFVDAATIHGPIRDLAAFLYDFRQPMASCPPAAGELFYWVNTTFTYIGRSFLLTWTNTECAETPGSGKRLLYADGDLVAVVDSLVGATHLYAQQLDIQYRTWHNASVISDLAVEALVRTSSEKCDPSAIGQICGRHWRDRLPDAGVLPELRFNGTPRFVPQGEPPSHHESASASMSIGAVALLLSLLKKKAQTARLGLR